jgi:hypothetical protein
LGGSQRHVSPNVQEDEIIAFQAMLLEQGRRLFREQTEEDEIRAMFPGEVIDAQRELLQSFTRRQVPPLLMDLRNYEWPDISSIRTPITP